jgi:glycosyltransferase involved in cell wall biosynthesis
MNRLPISVSMIAGAEARRIGRSLESVVPWVSEVIVVLNADVNDGTEEIARRHGAKVFREPWKGFIAQKASAAAKSAQEWVLGLDADEVVSPELREEILRRFANEKALADFAAFSVPRLTLFAGRWIRHGDWYPDRTARLWRRTRAEWGGEDPHARLTVRGQVGRLRSDLLHYNAATIDDQLAKSAPYSDAFVLEMKRRNRRASGFDLALRPAWRFVRSYFLRLGFLDGWQGYYIAWMTAMHTLTRYAKVKEAAVSSENPAARIP